MHFTLIRIDPPHALAGNTYWQETRDEGPDAALVGILDDDGDPVMVGNATWTALRSDLTPPFVA